MPGEEQHNKKIGVFMFFSIVIPTYNSRKTIERALISITHNDCIDDIEIIIADDCSTESFDDILDKFSDLHIRKIMNPMHYGAPYGGREFGCQAAQGQWVTFMDHDDEYVEYAFDTVKAYIEENDLHGYLVTDFYTYNDETQEIVEIIENYNWTHGKFYEKKFLVDNDVHYADTRSCEDINLSVQMMCIHTRLHQPVHYLHTFTYIWHQYPESLSQASGIGAYFFNSFPDYIDGTLKVYLDAYLEDHDVNNLSFYVDNSYSMIFYLYFYYQGLRYEINGCPPIPRLYYQKIYENFKRMKKYFKYNTKEFINNSKYDEFYVKEYEKARMTAKKQVPFFECESFERFVKLLPYRSSIFYPKKGRK